MILGKREIQRLLDRNIIKIEPLFSDSLQPASVDLHVSDEIGKPVPKQDTVDLDNISETVHIVRQRVDKYIIIRPKEYLLVLTREYVTLRENVAGIILPRSTLVRLGVNIPATWVDPAFSGRIVLEIFNMSNTTVRIPVGARVAQLVLIKCVGAVPYDGAYKDQETIKVRSHA